MSFFSKSNKKAKQKEEMEALMQEKETLIKSEEESRTKIDDMELKTKDLQMSVDRLTLENKELQEKLHTDEPYEKIFNERKDLLEQDIIKSLTIRDMENEIKELNETVATLKADNVQSISEKEAVHKELKTDREKIEELGQETQEMKKRIEELEKEKGELEDEIIKVKRDLETLKIEKEEEINRILNEEKKKEETQARAYIEDLRRQLAESKSKVENLQLESEALKSENEALFRANESKKKEIDEFQNDLTSIKHELQSERTRYEKLSNEWEEEKKRTQFVMVSKSAGRRQKQQPDLPQFKEEDDSEDEHLVSVVEAARAESEALREKERDLRKRVNQLQIDKEELFRSGTNLFAENKTMKAKYDELLNERGSLLQSEMALKRKNREYVDEIKDLKKTIDDLYYQNMAIKSNEENEKRNAYVVLMGNETITQLEREKSALHRRVKFLERENNEIEERVKDLEKRSQELIKYSQKYDKHSKFPAIRGREDNSIDGDRPRNGDRSRETDHTRNNNDSRDRYRDDTSHTISYHEYKDSRPPPSRTRSPDYYKSNGQAFGYTPSRQSSVVQASVRSGQSHGSHVSLPQIGARYSASPRQRTNSESQQSRRVNSLTVRR